MISVFQHFFSKYYRTVLLKRSLNKQFSLEKCVYLHAMMMCQNYYNRLSLWCVRISLSFRLFSIAFC